MKKEILKSLEKEALRIGLSLLLLDDISTAQLVFYNTNKRIAKTMEFHYDDPNCIEEIKAELHKVAEENLFEFYKMSGTLHLLHLAIKYSKGTVYVVTEDSGKTVKEYACCPDDLQEMVNFVSTELVEKCESCNEEDSGHKIILDKAAVDDNGKEISPAPAVQPLPETFPKKLIEMARIFSMSNEEILAFAVDHPDAINRLKQIVENT